MTFSSSATSCAVFEGSDILLFQSRAVLCVSLSVSGCPRVTQLAHLRKTVNSLHTGALTYVLVRRLTHNDRRRSSKCARYVPRNERGITDSPNSSGRHPDKSVSQSVDNWEVVKRVSDPEKAHTSPSNGDHFDAESGGASSAPCVPCTHSHFDQPKDSCRRRCLRKTSTPGLTCTVCYTAYMHVAMRARFFSQLLFVVTLD